MEQQTQANIFIWESQVRGYELDMQGVVNNANYLCYFDEVRVQHFLAKGLDWKEWHDNGFDFVLAHVDMAIKAPLLANDKFYVTSSVELSGRLRILFQQKIFRSDDNKLIAEAVNTVVCISIETRKPVMPELLREFLVNLQ